MSVTGDWRGGAKPVLAPWILGLVLSGTLRSRIRRMWEWVRSLGECA